MSDILKYQYNAVIKVPLILLEGRADLRTYYSNSSVEKPWNKSMYMCLKHHLQKCFPTQIRAEYNLPFGVTYATQNNQVLTDLGWHFTWMGDTVNRIIKAKSFCHYSDSLVESMKYYEPKEDVISPESIYFSNEDYVLKKYPIENLPQIIFELPRVKQFLLP